MCKSDEKVSIKTVNKMFEYQLTILITNAPINGKPSTSNSLLMIFILIL